jgi:phospholipid transport system substrate-binding protein
MSKHFFLLILFFALSLFPISAWAQSGPKEQLQITVDEIISNLKNKNLSKTEMRESIAETVKKRFNFNAMSVGTLTTNWKRATDEQKKKFTDLYTKLLILTYLGKVKNYNNEKVDYKKENIRENKASIDTLIISNGTEIPIQYRMINKDGIWTVYDILVENVSLIRNYRSTYAEIIKKKGLDGLLSEMENKVEELSNPIAIKE